MTAPERDSRDIHRRSGLVARLLGGAALTLLVVTAAASDDEALWTVSDTTTSETVEQERPTDTVVSSPRPAGEAGTWLPSAAPVLEALGALMFIGVVIFAAAILLRGTPDRSWLPVVQLRRSRRRRTLPSSTPLPDLPRAVEADDVAMFAALREGSPRNAIVRCWMVLEQNAAAAGMQRGPAETSSEYVVRVIGTSSVDPRPIADLGALFREARFSSRPVDETRREQAEQALRRTLAGLGVGPEQRP